MRLMRSAVFMKACLLKSAKDPKHTQALSLTDELHCPVPANSCVGSLHFHNLWSVGQGWLAKNQVVICWW